MRARSPRSSASPATTSSSFTAGKCSIRRSPPRPGRSSTTSRSTGLADDRVPGHRERREHRKRTSRWMRDHATEREIVDRSDETGPAGHPGAEALAILQTADRRWISARSPYYWFGAGRCWGGERCSRAPATPARTASSCTFHRDARRACGTRSWRRGAAGAPALRPRGAGHPAPGSQDGALRQRHRRDAHRPGGRPGLDREAREGRFRRAAKPWSRRRRRESRGSSSGFEMVGRGIARVALPDPRRTGGGLAR